MSDLRQLPHVRLFTRSVDVSGVVTAVDSTQLLVFSQIFIYFFNDEDLTFWYNTLRSVKLQVLYFENLNCVQLFLHKVTVPSS